MGRTSTPALLARTALLALISGLVAVPDAPAQTPSFTLMGIRSGSVESQNRGLSADGRVGAGSSGNRGYVWTAVNGRHDFDTEAGLPLWTPVQRLSGDGTTAVGWAGDPFVPGQIAFRWFGPGTFQTLPLAGGYANSAATGVNHDGSVIVGNLFASGNSSGTGFRWTAAGGTQLLPGGPATRVNAISRDGSVIVGESGVGSGAPQAVRWTTSGMQPLVGLTGLADSYARGVNFDGSFIVGLSGTGARATLWHNGLPISLGLPSGWHSINPLCVSDDGSVVAGQYFQIGSPEGAAIWTQSTGFIPLADYLTANGVTIPEGFRLTNCTAISADGMTFSGWTNGPLVGNMQGFVATIPSPGVLTLLGASLLAATRRRRR